MTGLFLCLLQYEGRRSASPRMFHVSGWGRSPKRYSTFMNDTIQILPLRLTCNIIF